METNLNIINTTTYFTITEEIFVMSLKSFFL